MPRRPLDLNAEELQVRASVLVDRIRIALRAKADAAGLRTLEEKTGRGRGYLSHLFNGAIKNLTLQQVFELLVALGILPASFFAEVLGEGAAPGGGLSRDELFDLVDAYMERRSAATTLQPPAAERLETPDRKGSDTT